MVYYKKKKKKKETRTGRYMSSRFVGRKTINLLARYMNSWGKK